jgi:hypothetical protein
MASLEDSRMPDVTDDRIIVPFAQPRTAIAPASEVRSTLLTASIDAVRKRGRYDEYVGHLAPEVKEAVLYGVAGVWLPMEVALAHYHAIDALGFTDGEAIENGYAVGGRLNGTFLGTALKVAAQAGATPWLPLGRAGTVVERVFRGGAGLQILRYGPKEARIDLVGVPVISSAYFRGALRGQIQAGCELFCRRCYTREVEPRSATGSTTIRVSWV